MTPKKKFERPDLRGGDPALLRGWTAGHYDLPPAVVEAAMAADRVHRLPEAILTPIRTELTARTDRQARAAAAARIVAGGDLVAESEAILRADAALADVDRHVSLWRDADAAGAAGVKAAIVAEADAIMTLLSAAYWETLAGVREIAPVLAGATLTVKAIAERGAEAGRAFLLLGDARARMDAILAAADRVRVASDRAREDRRGYFRDCFTFPRRTVNGFVPDGPADGLARLLWLVSDREARPWFPSLTEWTMRANDWHYKDRPWDRPERQAAAMARRAVTDARFDATIGLVSAERDAARAQRKAAEPDELAVWSGWPTAGTVADPTAEAEVDRLVAAHVAPALVAAGF